MVSQRNQLKELERYLSRIGISVNIGKNKARGNQGIFIAGKELRIDVSNAVDENARLSILLHEFAHYVHYCYDHKLKSLKCIFGELTENEEEELLRVTVHKIPKDSAKFLYSKKNTIKNDIRILSNVIKEHYPEFVKSKPFKKIEQNLSCPVKYLLRYDRIKYLNKIYSIEDIEKDFPKYSDYEFAYIKLKSKQRFLSRINSKINKLNKYYNEPTELWARFCELFYTDRNMLAKLAPGLLCKFEQKIKNGDLKEIGELNKLLNL